MNFQTLRKKNRDIFIVPHGQHKVNIISKNRKCQIVLIWNNKYPVKVPGLYDKLLMHHYNLTKLKIHLLGK